MNKLRLRDIHTGILSQLQSNLNLCLLVLNTDLSTAHLTNRPSLILIADLKSHGRFRPSHLDLLSLNMIHLELHPEHRKTRASIQHQHSTAAKHPLSLIRLLRNMDQLRLNMARHPLNMDKAKNPHSMVRVRHRLSMARARKHLNTVSTQRDHS